MTGTKKEGSHMKSNPLIKEVKAANVVRGTPLKN